MERLSTRGLEQKLDRSSFLLFGVNKSDLSEINDTLMSPNVTLWLSYVTHDFTQHAAL